MLKHVNVSVGSVLVIVLIASPAIAVDFRWTFDMGAGSMEAYVANASGSQLSLSCRSGGVKEVPNVSLDSTLVSKSGDEYVQFIVDKRNLPITFTKGYFEGGDASGRFVQNAVWNLLFALRDAHFPSFIAEYASKNKSERFSTLDARECGRHHRVMFLTN